MADPYFELDDAEYAPIPIPARVVEKEPQLDAIPIQSRPSPLNPLVAQYLQDKMAMGQAQQAANQNQLFASLARAGGTLAHAVSGAKTPIDESGYNVLDKNAQAPVQNIKDQIEATTNEAKLQGFLQDQKLKQAKLAQDQKEKEALSRPDSSETKALYDSFSKLNIRLPKGLTAAQIIAGFGKPAEFALAKFKEEEHRKTEVSKTGAKVPKGYVKRINPDTGVEELIPDDQAIKPSQFQAALYGKRMKQAEDVFSELTGKGFDAAALGNQAQRLPFYPEFMKNEDIKRQNQAERNFVNAVLRRESGAAISPSEFSSAEMQYFPRPGDSAPVLEQKKQNRALAIAALQAEAGGAWNKFGEKGVMPQGDLSSKMPKENNSVMGGDPLIKSAHAGGGFPMQIKKGGKVAIVRNAQELKEAKAEGWQ